MRRSIIVALTLWTATATAGDLVNIFDDDVQQDAYGHGIHSDEFARPFEYREPFSGDKAWGPVQEDGYGLGTHMDQYGRPVERDYLFGD